MNKEKVKKIISFFCNPRLLFCFALAWLVTNGWAYIMLGFGTYLDITWMMAVSGAYLTFIWLPISPEKILTIAITMALLRILFPHDKKTLAVLHDFYLKLKSKKKKDKKKRSEKQEMLALARENIKNKNEKQKPLV